MSQPFAHLQALFQDRLLTGAADIEAHLGDGGPFLKVYDNAYAARLMEVLVEDFPATHTLLGDDSFHAAANRYLRDHPSSRPSIRWLGAAFARWLRDTPPWDAVPVAPDMAAFEWGLGLAFDAPDATALDAEALATVPADHWPALTFGFHPALNTVELTHDVAPFQQAVATGRDPEAAPGNLSARETWAIWRDAAEDRVRFRPMTGDEAASLEVVRGGGTFADLCECAAGSPTVDNPALQAAGFLRGWLEAGWIVGFAVADQEPQSADT